MSKKWLKKGITSPSAPVEKQEEQTNTGTETNAKKTVKKAPQAPNDEANNDRP